MKIVTVFFLLIAIILFSCNSSSTHIHDGAYSLSINVFGANLNSKKDLIVNGDMVNFNGDVLHCAQYPDRIEVGDNKIVFTKVEGDLIVNVPDVGKLRYIKISGDNDLNSQPSK